MTKKQENTEAKIPDKAFIFANATTIALMIVLLTLGAIFLILILLK